MKVLLAAAEVAPWATQGATGIAVAELARGLRAQGAEPVVAVPDYPSFSGLARGRRRPLPEGGSWAEAEAGGLKLALVGKPEFFDRAGIYGAADSAYDDNLARFGFFARSAHKIAAALGARAVHGFDWPGALVAALGSGERPVTLGLSDFLFQGDFSSADLARMGTADWSLFEFHGRANALKAGLLSSAAVVLPGERMAHAVRSPGAGCGLEGVAGEVSSRLRGILAGADYGGWFDARSGKRKDAVRREWLSASKLDPLEEEGMLLLFAPGLCGGRGYDLLLPIFDRLMEFPVRVALLGHPPLHLAPAIQLKAMRYPKQFGLLGGEGGLVAAAAAADAILVPDALEPADARLACAMRSGAVPLAQWCPGLTEIVSDHDPAGQPGNGLVFYRHSPEALWDNFVRAFALRRSGSWDGLRARAAATDFSWEAAAGRYAALFRGVAA